MEANPPIVRNIKEPDCAPSQYGASACGKVIIVGEHAVVYGAKAIAIPVKELRTHLWMTSGEKMTLSPSEFTQRELANLQELTRQAFQILGQQARGITLDGKTALTIGAGLGSSASLCVCVVRVVSQFLGISLTPAEIAVLSNTLEKRFHGNPSGLDTAVVAHERPVVFQKGHEPQFFSVCSVLGECWEFVLIDTQERSSTRKMIEKAGPYFAEQQTEKIHSFDELADLVSRGLAQGVVEAVVQGMSQAHSYLSAAGLVTPNMARMAHIAQQAGVIAVKPTGAGGGGYLLGLLPPGAVSKVKRHLTEYFGEERLESIRLDPTF